MCGRCGNRELKRDLTRDLKGVERGRIARHTATGLKRRRRLELPAPQEVGAVPALEEDDGSALFGHETRCLPRTKVTKQAAPWKRPAPFRMHGAPGFGDVLSAHGLVRHIPETKRPRLISRDTYGAWRELRPLWKSGRRDVSHERSVNPSGGAPRRCSWSVNPGCARCSCEPGPRGNVDFLAGRPRLPDRFRRGDIWVWPAADGSELLSSKRGRLPRSRSWDPATADKSRGVAGVRCGVIGITLGATSRGMIDNLCGVWIVHIQDHAIHTVRPS